MSTAVEFDEAKKKYFDIAGVGRLLLRRPNVLDQLTIARTRSALVGEGYYDQDAMLIGHAIAVIGATAEVKPRNLDFTEVYDGESLKQFAEEHNRWVESFRPRVSEDAAHDSGAGEAGA